MLGMELFLLFLIFCFIFWKRKARTLPPGPRRIPLLGSLPFLSIQRGLFDWVLDEDVTRHKLTTVGLGPSTFFVINDFELTKELFSKEEFSGRNVSEFRNAHQAFDGKRQGIVVTEGSHWTKQRKFALKTLKDFGFGKQSLEDTINIEVEELIETFLSTDEEYLLSSDFHVPIINILWQLVAGSRFTTEDPEGMKMVDSVIRIFKVYLKMTFIPLKLLRMFPKVTGYEENIKNCEIQKNFIWKQIEEHEKSKDTDHPRDYIDVYLNEMENDVDGKNFTKKDLAISMMDFLHAGTETSATTMKWIVLYLTTYQDVQDKCREEILTVLGTSICTVADMMQLPYVQATVSEVQRHARPVPLSLNHKTLAGTEVEGFTIPAGSVFFANLAFIMMDPKHFPQPELFKPERFLGPDGKYEKNERMIPFGTGKRYCIGELLARNELFLFTVNLVQKLIFLPPKNNRTPDPANYHSGITNVPDDFYVRFVSV
eukprot:GFUD01005172.1.p1 GENE.GFUD01005172.1~~GFUD01005172.1.p1  ORF type:complete len:484 (+),score=104.63 GFUD01005172.1:98-1549(+)